jgi:hypothetical protein
MKSKFLVIMKVGFQTMVKKFGHTLGVVEKTSMNMM